MMVSPVGSIKVNMSHSDCVKIFPMAIIKGAIPWWSLPYNWIIGEAYPTSTSIEPDF